MDHETMFAAQGAEARFRRRLAAKLAARGCPEEAIPARIDDLLRTGLPLRLDVEAILGDAAEVRPG